MPTIPKPKTIEQFMTGEQRKNAGNIQAGIESNNEVIIEEHIELIRRHANLVVIKAEALAQFIQERKINEIKYEMLASFKLIEQTINEIVDMSERGG